MSCNFCVGSGTSLCCKLKFKIRDLSKKLNASRDERETWGGVSMVLKIESRKVTEVKQKLSCAVNKRIWVANELRDADIEIDQVENVDGTKPHILIRIKRIIRRPKK